MFKTNIRIRVSLKLYFIGGPVRGNHWRSRLGFASNIEKCNIPIIIFKKSKNMVDSTTFTIVL
jgi:hypothetical protein